MCFSKIHYTRGCQTQSICIHWIVIPRRALWYMSHCVNITLCFEIMTKMGRFTHNSIIQITLPYCSATEVTHRYTARKHGVPSHTLSRSVKYAWPNVSSLPPQNTSGDIMATCWDTVAGITDEVIVCIHFYFM